MLKSAIALAFAGASLAVMTAPASASSGDKELRHVAHAIMTGEYVSAEQEIADIGRDRGTDAAMLINLGHAYAGMGRRVDAELAYKAALRADPRMELDMADGSVRSVYEVATESLQLLGTSYAGR